MYCDLCCAHVLEAQIYYLKYSICIHGALNLLPCLYSVTGITGMTTMMSCEVLGKLHSLKHNLKPPWT